MTKEMHLVGYCCATPTWHNNGAWRHPDSDGLDFLDPKRYENIARILERGKFDGVFMVDVLAIPDTYGNSFAANLRQPGQTWMMDPLQLLTSMARVTSRLGLASTMSTTFYSPFHIARAMASLDHISGGRAGWNVVTSLNDREAQNFGFDKILDKSERYERGDEVLEACHALWNSWEPDALIMDQEKGIFADPSKVHYVNYEGKYVKTRGPLSTPHMPQGSPVLMQAGASDRGREFAARWAEVVFTMSVDKPNMQKFYRDLKDRVEAAGRPAGHCAVLPSIDVVVGESDAHAQEQADYINSLVSAELGVAEISNAIGTDLSHLSLDTVIEDLQLGQGPKGMLDIVMQGAKGKTLREAGYLWGTRQMAPQVVGSATTIADFMQDHFESDACDGFIICPSLSPVAYEHFVDLVVPELQRRGVYRKDYTGHTFRDHLRDQG